MGTKLRFAYALLTSLFLPGMVLAMDDIPLYLDAGCTNKSIPGSFAQGPADMHLPTGTNGGGEIPINCTEQLTGTDAMEIKLDRALTNGEYWDFQVKTPVDRYFLTQGYVDIRFWVKNKLSTPATFKLTGQTANYSPGNSFDTVVAGGGTWQQFVIPLSRITDTALNALQFSQPTTLSPNPIDLLVDSITITDGTENGSLNIPAAVHPPRPSDWGADFLIGSFDNRPLNTSSKAYQAGIYRYQYVMPDIMTQYSPSGQGYIYDYVKESDTMGVKTAIVFYNLGKSGEGYSAVTANLASAAYMSDYVSRYEYVLSQLVLAGSKDYILVLEPDMYGFLMTGPNGVNFPPIEDPAKIVVNMDAASAAAGVTYPPNLVGWATYMVQRAKTVLKNNGVIIGHMPNHWGVNIPGQVGNGRKEAHIISGQTIARFLNRLGPQGIGDVVFVEKTDNDASNKTSANWMWDSTGYAKYLLWTRCIANGTHLPIVGWQISEAHSTDPDTNTRDNAVESLLANPGEWVDGGFAGILYGPGNPGNANYGTITDGNWFVDHMATFSYPLPTAGLRAIPAFAAGGIHAFLDPDGFRLEGWSGRTPVRIWNVVGTLLYVRPLFSGDRIRLTQAHGLLFWAVGDRAQVGTGRIFIP